MQRGSESADNGAASTALLPVKENFFATQRANLSAVGYALPGIGLTFGQRYFGINSDVDGEIFTAGHRQYRTNVDLTQTADFMAYLKKKAPSNDLVAELVVYRLPVHPRLHYRIISAFLYHPSGAAVSPADLKLLQSFVEDVLTRSYAPNLPKYRFITVGTLGRFDAHCQPRVADPSIILCEQVRENIWQFKLPNNKRGICTNEFLSHILPGDTFPEIQAMVEQWESYDGQITVKNIKAKLEVAPEALLDETIEQALDKLFDEGDYGVKTYKADHGEVVRYVVKHPKTLSGAKKARRFSIPTIDLKKKYTCGMLFGVVCILGAVLPYVLMPKGVVAAVITVGFGSAKLLLAGSSLRRMTGYGQV